MSMATTSIKPVGELLRDWRERRRLSQLELSSRAEVSTRHLSFVETGRARPTPQMILRLSDQLEVPLRERNELLLAAGFAPAYPRHGLDEPELAVVRAALSDVLVAHLPFPALVVDRHWNLVLANDAISTLVAGATPWLLEAPVNVLRLSLHPDGLAGRILNLAQWRSHLLEQLRRRSYLTADPLLADLHEELLAYPGGLDAAPPGSVVVPLRIRTENGDLAFFSIASHVQTAADVTVDELSIEGFYPADEHTANILRIDAGDRIGG